MVVFLARIKKYKDRSIKKSNGISSIVNRDCTKSALSKSTRNPATKAARREKPSSFTNRYARGTNKAPKKAGKKRSATNDGSSYGALSSKLNPEDTPPIQENKATSSFPRGG